MRKLLLFLIVAGVVGGGFWFYKEKHGTAGLKKIPVVGEHLAGLFDSSDEEADAAPGELPVSRQGETIRIASFNIQVFGTTKAGKPHVMERLAQIVRQFDIVAIQEIRCKDESLLPQFVELINSTGRHYDYAIGPRLGRSNSKEQYAYIFDRASVEIDRAQLYSIDDPDDLLHREPYVAWFRVRGPHADQAFTFTLVNIHTDPDETTQELNALDDVYHVVRADGRNEDDVIILGDLNVNDRNMGQLGEVAGITWAISGMPTNTRGTAHYDNIVFHAQATREYTGRSGVFDLMRAEGFNLTMEDALEISDHMPIWAEFSIYEGGTPGRVAVVSVD